MRTVAVLVAGSSLVLATACSGSFEASPAPTAALTRQLDTWDFPCDSALPDSADGAKVVVTDTYNYAGQDALQTSQRVRSRSQVVIREVGRAECV